MNQEDEESSAFIQKTEESLVMPQYVDTSIKNRLGLIQKVYSILTIQLTIAGILTWISVNYLNLRQFETTLMVIQWFAALASFGILCLIMCQKKHARESPRKIIFYCVFSLLIDIVISTTCCHFSLKYENAKNLINIAVFLTIIALLNITGYVYFTERDFNFWIGLQVSFITNLVSLSLVYFILRIEFNIVVTVAIIFLYTVYILLGTSLIVGSQKRYSLRKDDYILAFFVLYADIIMLWLDYLRISAQIIWIKKK